MKKTLITIIIIAIVAIIVMAAFFTINTGTQWEETAWVDDETGTTSLWRTEIILTYADQSTETIKSLDQSFLSFLSTIDRTQPLTSVKYVLKCRIYEIETGNIVPTYFSIKPYIYTLSGETITDFHVAVRLRAGAIIKNERISWLYGYPNFRNNVYLNTDWQQMCSVGASATNYASAVDGKYSLCFDTLGNICYSYWNEDGWVAPRGEWGTKYYPATTPGSISIPIKILDGNMYIDT